MCACVWFDGYVCQCVYVLVYDEYIHIICTYKNHTDKRTHKCATVNCQHEPPGVNGSKFTQINSPPTHTHTNTHTQIHMYVYIYIYIYVCVCLHMYLCVCA